MAKPPPVFSSEYTSGDETQGIPTEDTTSLPQMKVDVEMYGVGKPIRAITRATIIHDQD